MTLSALPCCLVLLALLVHSEAQRNVSQIGNCTFHAFDGDQGFLWEVAAQFGKVYGHLSAAVCVFGLLANLANVIVLTRKELANSSTNRILMWLALADLLMFVAYLPHVLFFNVNAAADIPAYHTTSWGWIKFSEFVVSFNLVCHASAVWLTVLLAFFRYLYIAFPQRGPAMASLQNAQRASIFVILVAASLCVPNIVLNSIEPCELESSNGTTQVIFTISMNPQYPALMLVNFWLQAIIQKIIPSLCLTVFTFLLIREMRMAASRRAALKGRCGERHSSARENRTTLMLLTIVLLFLLLVMPNGILLCLSQMNQQIRDNVYVPLGDFLDLSSLINESINFILYTTMSQQFRQIFVQTLCPACLTSRRQWRAGAKPSTKLTAPANVHNGGKTAEATCLVPESRADAKTCLVVHSNFDGSSGELSSTV